MAEINSLGLISGINVNDIVDKLVALEQKKIKNLQVKESNYNLKISTYGELANKLKEIKDALSGLDISKNNYLTTVSSNNNVLVANVNNSASTGNYQIKVIQLAQSQSLFSRAFTSLDQSVGTGILTINVNNEIKNIAIDGSNNTVSGIVSAINNSGAKVKASAINDGSGYRIVVVGQNTGLENSFSITVTDDDGFDDDLNGLSSLRYDNTVQNMTLAREAKNSKIQINGVTIERASNTISDAISGVTLTLKNASAEEINLDVTRDYSLFKSKISKFVESYNSAVNAIENMIKKGSIMSSEMATRAVRESLRNQTYFNYEGKSLLSFGVSHDRYGKLQINEEKLDIALKENFESTTAFFNSLYLNVSGQIDKTIDTYITKRKENLKVQIENLKTREEIENKRIDEYKNSLIKKFTNMEKALAQLQTSSIYLTNQLNNLNNKK